MSKISSYSIIATPVAGDIILDADGGEISFKDNGVEIGRIINDSSSLQIRSTVNNKDIVLAGVSNSSFSSSSPDLVM